MNQNNIVCGAIVSVCVVVGFCWRAGILSKTQEEPLVPTYDQVVYLNGGNDGPFVMRAGSYPTPISADQPLICEYEDLWEKVVEIFQSIVSQATFNDVPLNEWSTLIYNCAETFSSYHAIPGYTLVAFTYIDLLQIGMLVNPAVLLSLRDALEACRIHPGRPMLDTQFDQAPNLETFFDRQPIFVTHGRLLPTIETYPLIHSDELRAHQWWLSHGIEIPLLKLLFQHIKSAYYSKNPTIWGIAYRFVL